MSERALRCIRHFFVCASAYLFNTFEYTALEISSSKIIYSFNLELPVQTSPKKLDSPFLPSAIYLFLLPFSVAFTQPRVHTRNKRGAYGLIHEEESDARRCNFLARGIPLWSETRSPLGVYSTEFLCVCVCVQGIRAASARLSDTYRNEGERRRKKRGSFITS